MKPDKEESGPFDMEGLEQRLAFGRLQARFSIERALGGWLERARAGAAFGLEASGTGRLQSRPGGMGPTESSSRTRASGRGVGGAGRCDGQACSGKEGEVNEDAAETRRDWRWPRLGYIWRP